MSHRGDVLGLVRERDVREASGCCVCTKFFDKHRARDAANE